jgi:hypothetical protein
VLVSALRALDRMLRGDATRLAELKTGQLDLPLRQIGPVLLFLAALYGAAMGLFATLHQGQPQVALNLLKVPGLFLFTLLVTFPSLCVFNILVGSRLSARTLLNMLVVSLGVMIVVLASLAPILVFFTLSTRSHPFMVLLNGLNFLIAAAWGRSFLVQTMHGLLLSEDSTTSTHSSRVPPAGLSGQEPAAELQFDDELPTAAAASGDGSASPPSQESPGAVESTDPGPGSNSGTTAPAAPPAVPPAVSSSRAAAPRQTPVARPAVSSAPSPSRWQVGFEPASPVAKVRGVLRTWLWIFVGVGLQMTWILGPFVGTPQGEFRWFHPPGEGNFLQGFWTVLTNLFG